MTGTPDTSQPRQRNPRGHGDRLHGELLDAAVRVLAAHGDTERLSIRAVAAEAQVSPPAVYRHLPDRRALVRTVVETCFERFQAQLTQAEQGQPARSRHCAVAAAPTSPWAPPSRTCTG